MKINIWIKRLVLKLSIIKELLLFLWQNKLWWMVPIVMIFLLLGLLIFLTQSSAVVPFIYALF